MMNLVMIKEKQVSKYIYKLIVNNSSREGKIYCRINR